MHTLELKAAEGYKEEEFSGYLSLKFNDMEIVIQTIKDAKEETVSIDVRHTLNHAKNPVKAKRLMQRILRGHVSTGGKVELKFEK